MVSDTVAPPQVFAWMKRICAKHAAPYLSVAQGIGVYWVVSQMRSRIASIDPASLQMTRRLRPHLKQCCLLGDEVMDEIAHRWKQRKGGLSAEPPPYDPEWDQ